jgi:hypothetical protein
VGPPDFVGVGAQRSGTTWWWRLLCDHPRIHRGAGKEHHFFDSLSDRELTDRDVERYHESFPRPPGTLVGEWSPLYMHSFWAPRMLKRAAPEARILVMLRDPLERYRSGLSHEIDRLNRRARRRQRTYIKAMCANDALARSLYAAQLERLLEYFSQDQVLVLQYERCAADPAAELRRTFSFLGASPETHTPAHEIITRRGRSPRRVELPAATEREVIAAVQADLPALKALAPDLDLELWRSSHGPASGRP